MASKENNSEMTVNERLHNAGLLEAFYRAGNNKDRDKMIAMLMSIEFERLQAEQTVDAILNNPAFDER